MSAIIFHNEHAEARVRGWERAAFGALCNDLLLMSLGVSRYDTAHAIRKSIPHDAYVLSVPDGAFYDAFTAWLNVSAKHLVVDGKQVDVFEIALNTALTIGGDVVKLAARLHGQCEVHAYVETINREWLADIVERGRKDGILRAKSGWEDAVTLLRSTVPGPVVTSYTVTEQFPNPYICQRAGTWECHDEDIYDSWLKLPLEKQWQFAMAALRQDAESFELKPDDWNDLRFGDGMNGFDVRRYCNAKD